MRTKDQNNIVKGRDGQWRGETLTTVKGQDFEIATYKRDNGTLQSRAMPVAINNGGGISFSSTDIFNKQIHLVAEKVSRVTEKVIREQHLKAVILFDEMVEAGKIQPEVKLLPKIGSIIFTDSNSQSKGSRGNFHIVYKIQETDFGTSYLTVEPTTLSLQTQDYVKPYSDKFGIGNYFDPDYNYEGDDQTLADIVMDAVQKRDRDEEEKHNEQMVRELQRSEDIAEGRELVEIPKDAKTIIVAKHYRNTSDYMTDYYSTTVEELVYLAFSNHDKNNMAELKAAAKRFKETKDFPDSESYTKNTNYASHQLPTYFFGTDSWSGWKVTKLKYTDVRNKEVLEDLYIAAAQGRYFCLKEDYSTAQAEGRADREKVTTDTIGGIEIVDYSEKAIAVIGDTKPLKDQLKALGGRFNFRLKCGAGWIFAKTKTEEVKELLAEALKTTD